MHDAASAREFARHAHRNHVGYAGEPYFEHVDRVIGNVRKLLDALPEGLLTDEEKDEILQAAALHDCAEDERFTGVSHADLAAEGFPSGVLQVLRRLDNRFKVGSYQGNIQAMVDEGDIRVVIVKLGDNMDNRDPVRNAALPPEMRSILKRYERAGAVLQAAYDEFAARSVPTYH